MPAWVTAGWEDYARRLPREFVLSLIELKPEPRDSGKPTGKLLEAEATRILAACKGARLIALDERGESWPTRVFAERIAAWREERTDLAFVIGSADGLAEPIKRAAGAVLALSAMTLPHALVRIVLAEQIYRAVSLNAGHPYHRQ